MQISFAEEDILKKLIHTPWIKEMENEKKKKQSSVKF